MTFTDISLIGYLGHDPVAGETANGTTSSRFSVATTDRRRSTNGDVREQTSWFRVTAYGRLAEIAQAHLAKGRQVFVRGKLRLEEYTDRDGALRLSAEVTAVIASSPRSPEVPKPIAGIVVPSLSWRGVVARPMGARYPCVDDHPRAGLRALRGAVLRGATVPRLARVRLRQGRRGAVPPPRRRLPVLDPRHLARERDGRLHGL